MELVTVINRTNKPLEVLWDGKRRPIPVGKSQHTLVVAEKAKEQNVLMGSQDPRDPRNIIYLVGIEEHGEDCSQIDPTPRGIERWNRSLMPGGYKDVEVVDGRTGLFSARDVQTTLTGEVSFSPNPDSNPIPKVDPI